LRQERLDELIYLSILNADHLPGPKTSPLSPTNYSRPVTEGNISGLRERQSTTEYQSVSRGELYNRQVFDKLIIGAGLAGLVSGWQSCLQGQKTQIIAKGLGSIHWSSGCIDVLGYLPGENGTPITSLYEGISQLATKSPRHPYTIMGIDETHVPGSGHNDRRRT
jgi:hypothetical protein